MSVSTNQELAAEPRLDEMKTDWDLVRLAHSGHDGEAREARGRLLSVYDRPAGKYLAKVAHNPHTADELLSDFRLHFMQGAFHHANPSKGELGVMIKATLRNMVVQFQWRQRRQRLVQTEDLELLLESRADQAPSRRPNPYRAEIRQRLLEAAWAELNRETEEHPGTEHYTVLALRVFCSDDSCADLAQALSHLFEHGLSDNAVRIKVHNARVRFAAALWHSAMEHCDPPGDEAAKELLDSVGLWQYFSGLLRSNHDSEPGR